VTTPTPTQTRKAVQRVFELATKRHACREMAIVATAQTLCLRVEEVRKHLEPKKEPTP
jgi:hypothetical protein